MKSEDRLADFVEKVEPWYFAFMLVVILAMWVWMLSGCAGSQGPDWERVAWAAGNMRANLRASEDRAERNQERFQDQVYREQLLIQLQNQDRY